MRLSLIHEMASLAGWHPPTNDRWAVYEPDQVNDDGTFDGAMEFVFATSAEEARAAFGKHRADLIGGMAADAGVSPAELLSSLVIVPANISGEGGTFSDKDLSSIRGQQRYVGGLTVEEQITKWLNDNPTPYKYVFHFGDGLDVKKTPGVITFIKHGNAGGDTLTAHMILHTLGHAVVDNSYQDLTEPLIRWFMTLNRINETAIYDTFEDEIFDMGSENEQMALKALCKLLHMRAAHATLVGGSNRGFPDLTELVNELAGIYAKNGAIKVAPNKFCDFKVTPELLVALKLILENYLKGIFERAVGTLVFDD